MPSPLALAGIDLSSGTTDPKPIETLSLAEALAHIREGMYQRRIEWLRQQRTRATPDAYSAAKRRLPAMTFCGTFSPRRGIAHLKQHSGIVHGDLDHLEDIHAVKRRVATDPHVVYIFVAPSGDGLKLGVHVDPVPDDRTYKRTWQAVATVHQQLYGLTWDPSGKDISRLCYVSWDAAIYVNLDALRFAVPEPAARPTPCSTTPMTSFDIPRDRREHCGRQAIETATAMIEASTLGNRHHARLRASELLGGYVAGGIVSYDEAWGALAQAMARNSEHPDRSMKTITAGLQHGQSRAITLKDLEAERQAWLTAQGHLDRHTCSSIVAPSAPESTNRGTPYHPYRGSRLPRLSTLSRLRPGGAPWVRPSCRAAITGTVSC